MPTALVDKFSQEELKQMTQESDTLTDLLRKIGYRCIDGGAGRVVKKRLEKYNIDYSHFTLVAKNREKRTFENSFCENSLASQKYIRKHFKEKYCDEYKCEICGLPSIWNGKPLTLHLDHINGDHHDNRLENLRWICPNCHTQTETYAGKNKTSYIN